MAPKKKKETRGRKPWTKEQRQEYSQKRKAAELIVRPAVTKALTDREPASSATLPPQVDLQEYQNIFRWFEMGMTKPTNDQEWTERIMTFFKIASENDELITWEKFCLAIGYTTQQIQNYLNGAVKATPTVMGLLQKSKQFVSSYDATLVAKGKLNPIAYIFRGKQYYGFKTDSMLEKESTSNDLLDQIGIDSDPDSLAAKYLNSIPVDD